MPPKGGGVRYSGQDTPAARQRIRNKPQPASWYKLCPGDDNPLPLQGFSKFLNVRRWTVRKTNCARAFTAVLVTLLGIGSSAAAQNPLGIENFGKVNNTYYRGAQPEAAGYASLAAMGVKTIINLTSHDADPGEQAMVTRNGMAYLQIPMSTRVEPTKDQLATFLSVVNDPARQPVYVHCVGGRHRTGVMTAVYRMTHDGWTADRAFREMKQYKYGADFLHPEFKRFVYSYRPETSPLVATQIAVSR